MAQQIKKKFIGDDQVDGTKILLANNEAIRAKDASGVAKEIIKIDASDKVIIHKVGGAEEIAYKSQVDSVSSGLSGEIARAADAEFALSSSISTVASDLSSEATRAADAEAQALIDAKAYTDAKKVIIDASIASVNSRVDDVLSNVDAAALDSLTEIVTAFQAADSSLDGAITSLASSASSGLSQEILDRQAADSSIQSELDLTQSDLSSEITRAEAAEGVISSDLSSLSSTVASNNTAIMGRVDILEAFKAAQDALVKVAQKVVLNSTNISNGYIDLGHASSDLAPLLLFIDRLVLHPGAAEDYSVSVIGGVTRITFLNDLVSPGSQMLSVGDDIYARYSYSTI